jgi:hypothetical protein
VRAVHPDDLTANLALANIYERLSREAGLRPDQVANLLASSEQAIDRVLDDKDAATGQRVEALALRGRNEKTRWRSHFANAKSLAERRSAAMNRSLRQSFQAYRDAFREDLNHFWSGLAALQMGTIFSDLSGDGAAWKNSFDNDDEADDYRRKLRTGPGGATRHRQRLGDQRHSPPGTKR